MRHAHSDSRGMLKAALVAVLLAVAGLAPLAAEEAEPFIQVIPRVELGFVAVLQHLYQSGDELGGKGTLFNFVTQGGQDTLFPYQRYAADVVLGGRHIVTLLYQPLTLNTRTVVDANEPTVGTLDVGDASFAAGTPLELKYGFDFWRASYLYDFAKSPDTILGAGLSLQIRNASIVFSAVDGSEAAVQQNIGPVPILKVRAAHQFSPAFGLDFEADGFYASSAFFNGSGRAFEGWVWDAALTATTTFMPGAKAFLVVRSIGGGAEGNNAYDYESWTTSNPGSYTYNALATLAVSLGVTVQK